MRFAAGPQVFSPLPRRADLPILLIPAEDGAVLKAGGSPQTVPAGRLLLLPRQNEWRVTFHRDMRAIVLSVTAKSSAAERSVCRNAAIPSSSHRADWPMCSAAPWRARRRHWKRCRPRPGTRSASALLKCC